MSACSTLSYSVFYWIIISASQGPRYFISSTEFIPPSLSLSCFSWPFSTLPGDSPTFLPHSFVKDPTFQGREDQLANHSPDKPASGLRLAELQLAGGSPHRYRILWRGVLGISSGTEFVLGPLMFWERILQLEQGPEGSSAGRALKLKAG